MAHIFDLSGQTALVTGATRGIGAAMALALAEGGANLVLIARNDLSPGFIAEVSRLGRQHWTYKCDLGSPTDVERIVAEILQVHHIDILVNAAGIQRRADAAEYSYDLLHEVLQVNVTSPFTLCREVGKHWIAHGYPGRIVNVSSLASFQGGVRMAGYSVSKGGIAMLTKALSNEWAAHGIRVNAIAPGYIATDMNLDTRTNADPAYFNSISQRIPVGRWGQPCDFKGVTIFLASKLGTTYLTGETIAIDGGWLAR